MNRREIKTISEAAKRFMNDSTTSVVEGVSNSVRVELPFVGIDTQPLYFFIIKRKDSNRFSLILHTESVGISQVQDTLSRVQSLLKSYGLLLSQEGVIMEENIKIPLHKRMTVMAQAITGIDSVRRLWKAEHERK